MKRLAALVSCFVFLFVSSVSYTCSAADEEPDYSTVTSPFTADDLIDFGYFEISDGNFVRYPGSDISLFGTSTDANYTVKYPDFDINKIDLSSFPDEVYEIVKDTNSTILVYVQSVTAVDIFVARNCFLATTDGYGYTHLFFDNNPSQTSYYFNHACYKARYKWGKTADEYTLSSYWSEPTIKAFGTSGTWSYYATASKPGFVGDFYAFNTNHPRQTQSDGTLLPADHIIYGSSGTLSATGYDGVLDEVYTKYNSYYYTNSYSIRMIPGSDFPTHEKQQASVQKGIWGSIKELITKVTNLPGNIASSIQDFFTNLRDTFSENISNLSSSISGYFNSLFESISNFFRNLFIPSEEFFDLYIENFQTFFSERFGFLYELPNAIVSILRSLISYKPSTEGYFIHFPAVSVPSIGADGKLVWHQIIGERDIFFDFLNNGPFSVLYNGYRSFVWLAYCLMLAQQMSRKYNEVFGGG